MKTTRRGFLRTWMGASLAAAAAARPPAAEPPRPDSDSLERILAEPVFRRDLLKAPVRIEALELLRSGRQFLVRARSSDGAESVTVPNNSRLLDVYPLLIKRVAPFFIGKDARDLEQLLWEVYRHQSNYKFQGLAFWVCVATVEMALLDLLGQISGIALGDLLGGVRRRDIGVYQASGNRGNTPEEEVNFLRRIAAETGAKAVKFRLGGRMSRNADSLPGRTEALIPLVRQAFGDALTLYADSNSSYDAPNAIRIGRLLEEHHYAMFEEPCEFDDLWATKQVSDALSIPIGLGEQEFSMRRFQWVIENRAADIIQPDLHYFGGYIRCTRVARMAAAAGMPCTLHLSESGFAYLNVLHFASYIADPGPFQEFKGATRIPFTCDTSPLVCRNGSVRCPSGPGFGVRIDPDYARTFRPVKDV
ncbi:MAG TPA: mandelate racemase/muconate lactonizing enzyme family protein [Candidatus Paceibacterota bacterium]|nr:mandelate racemase/muconate lactonizing enzyme family protein [Verrucomicrobiota bacterium]HRZ47312.1 mandelate racemase/muconate lactonizing enzyme family protein [Candidatus Paceibacterota bacterium]HRZ93270.1 mandelate racemase/muconate lactonizing enzyme family protein [Candidatus Paceibacterota bacterium]